MPVETGFGSDIAAEVGHSNSHSLAEFYRHVRAMSEQIASPLSAEDCMIQSMPEASPMKWHLAHTTWFFETFLLKQRPHFQAFDERFESLFNSYYNGIGKAFPRDKRGQVSRPGLKETLRYRNHVDSLIRDWIDSETLSDQQSEILVLGLNHEQQHQELMLTDIKHVLFSNPGFPVYQESSPLDIADESEPLRWCMQEESIAAVGNDTTLAGTVDRQSAFAYDNEGPRHRTLILPHKIATRCVTNGEYLEFIEAGGYQDPAHWLSLGWDTVCRCSWNAPLYWLRHEDAFMQYSLAGLRPLKMNDPVCHISYFEADAYARWAGKRLPTEFEWEIAAQSSTPGRVFADNLLRDGAPIQPTSDAASDFLGNAWEWTSSPYSPYPGYVPVPGILGEYNGKFMCNQFVLRGGSCATSSDHIRITYRNFFPPETRWQFSGIRLAD